VNSRNDYVMMTAP